MEDETPTSSPPPPPPAAQHLNPPSTKPPSPPTPTPTPSPSPTLSRPSHSSSSAASPVPNSSTKVAPSKTSPPQTLTISVPLPSRSQLSPSDVAPDRPTFSQLLAGAMASSPLANSPQILAVPMMAVPCFVAPGGLMESPQFSGQFGMTHQAVLASVTAQAQMQLQMGLPSPSSSSFLQPISSPSSVTPQQEAEQLPNPEQKPRSSHVVVKTTSNDGYNWRKYGQKQVKSSDNSRSYYRCTHANCSAKKKIEHSQHGHIIEIVCQGEHDHEPPQKVKFSKERGSHGSQSSGALKDDQKIDIPNAEVNHADHHSSKTEQDSGNKIPEQLQSSNDAEVETATNKEEDLSEGPNSKRRLCEVPVAFAASLFKAVREAKIVVQRSYDEGPVNDGYRWRKYGQKIVKGNPNPRSYYKCTHLGCPVRKHVERAEDVKSIITTYEGHHNHDIPPPRVSNDTPASITSDKPIEASSSSDKTPFECKPVSKMEDKGEITSEPGEKLPESALPTIGCGSTSEGKGGGNGSDVIQRPLFDESCAAVPVENS